MDMEFPQSPETVARELVEDVLAELAVTDQTRFAVFFRCLRDRFPKEVRRMCMRYLAGETARDPVFLQTLAWLKMTSYFKLLLDPEFLAIDGARKVAELLRTEDPHFFLNFSRLTANLESSENNPSLARALALVEGLSDYNVLFPWLRGLTSYPDERIRSQAVKAFCRLKSNTAIVTRQLKSADARVRANAIEALWNIQNAEIEAIFRGALLDEHHRVVINALVGLYYQGDTGALPKLLEYTNHSNEMYRLAVIWALGYLAQPEAIPVLRSVSESDISESVRDKAVIVLGKLLAMQRVETAAAA